MKPVLLTDFGSTYTKLTAVDVDTAELLGTAAAYTTVQTDINEGFAKALCALEEKTGKLDYAESYACSSAAGGLRMMASGLVPELTLEAARMASLGAGAKLIGQFSFELTEDDLDTIRAQKPDIFLLAGGTDGGNTSCILHNARMLASLKPDFPIIVAGNRTAARECMRILSDCHAQLCENVMPRFGVLKTEQTQAAIRDIFLGRIIQAKGLDKAARMMNDILMPTPAAVLSALELLSGGCESESGIGELCCVDVGGATTDVYSICEGMPKQMNLVYKGLPEPYAKRTVEGDIGMRYSVLGILEAAGARKLAQLSGLTPERVEELCRMLSQHTDLVPQSADDELAALDFALAAMAVQTATRRHAGTIEETYTMLGPTFVQSGKDLSAVRRIVATGGSLIHSAHVRQIAAFAAYDPADPGSLRPKDAEVLGILEAAGARKLAQLSGLTPERVEELCRMLSQHTDLVPQSADDELAALDFALAAMAVQTATRRHAGTIEETYTMLGPTFVQSGKDLSAVRRIVATGGSLIHSAHVRQIAAFAAYDPADPGSLRPKDAEVLVDESYILAAMGLLSTHYPEAALQIMKRKIR